VSAIPLADYRANIQKCVSLIESLSLTEKESVTVTESAIEGEGGTDTESGTETETETATETESPENYEKRFSEALISMKTLMPLRQQVEWETISYEVDHTWLHQQMGELEKADGPRRARMLACVWERLKASQERLMETENKTGAASRKDEEQKKLQDIFSRPEYAPKENEASALSRLWARFLRWFWSLFPRVEPTQQQPTSARRITTASQIVVVVLSLAVLALVLRALVERLRSTRRLRKKKQKPRARIILGERLEPDQSAGDLLDEAERLARNGEIRTAIRKAYVALLVELGDRKILSLAQNKTNRDYLRALRQREQLHERMITLTNSFERHWYGLAPATETDWLEFRDRFRAALQE
jgi:hypothetical protein